MMFIKISNGDTPLETFGVLIGFLPRALYFNTHYQ